jgi:hypothetical protein
MARATVGCTTLSSVDLQSELPRRSGEDLVPTIRAKLEDGSRRSSTPFVALERSELSRL